MRQIEAFILRCHRDRIFFSLHSEKVVAITHGWELIDEILIDPGSPARRVRRVEPPIAIEIGNLLVSQQYTLRLTRKDRDVDEDWLLENLNEKWKRVWKWRKIDRQYCAIA